MDKLLIEYQDIAASELPIDFLLLWAIQYPIYLVPSANFLNLPYYRMSLAEHKQLQKIVDEKLDKQLIQHSLSRCPILALLVPKKDKNLRMHIDNRFIIKIMIKYHFLIPWLEDMLDMLADVSVFSKLDLSSGYHKIHVWLGDEWKMDFMTHEELFE